MSIPAWGGTPTPKTSRIGSNFSASVSNTMKALPSRMGGNSAQAFAPQRAGIQDNSSAVAPVNVMQQDVIQTPTAGVDIYEPTGTKGIAGIGQAANNEVNIRLGNKQEQQQKEFDAQMNSEMAGATDKLNNAWATNGGQEGVSLSPKLGANGSASWINANNNKYHDFDGWYGAQCVDLYNFYMTGFVGGRSSVGMGGVGYAQELWGNHDRGSLVQVAKNQKPQMGDIAIWSNAMNGMGGHVAIVAQDNGNGTIRVLNANVASNGGSKGTSVMSNLATGTLMGYLRPKKLM